MRKPPRAPHKKAFFSDQCKEIEENNRMGKTRDLFKKIRDSKGTFHAKTSSIKDRNGMAPLFPFHRLERWGEGSCVRVRCLPRVSGTLHSSLSAGSLFLFLSPTLHCNNLLKGKNHKPHPSLPSRSFVHALCPPLDPGSASLSLCWKPPAPFGM